MNELHALYLEQPHEISLETISLCNAACTFCPYPTLDRKGDKMADWLIDKVTDEMQDFEQPFFFSPFKVNEPLLDNRLIDICKSALRNPRTLLRIFTNGAALTQRWIDDLSTLDRVYHLWVSLNSHKPDEYEALMAMPLERTVKRLDNLHDQDFPHPVVLSTVGHPNPDFIDYCAFRWPKFQAVAISQSAWLGYTESQREEVPETPCSRWWELSIISSGVVSLCCMDGEAKYAIGDIRENTLLEVYNNPHWRERRERLLNRHDVPVCQTCTY